jgi:hypothetical protein
MTVFALWSIKMKKFARIENDIVMEVIEANEKPEFHPSIIIVEASEWVAEDDIYKNGTFTRPQKSLSDLKAEKIAELTSLYEQKIAAGYVFERNTYQIDAESQTNMNAIYTKLAGGGTNPHGGVWRDAQNTMIGMDDEKVKAFIDEVFVFVFNLKRVLWTHKDAIRAISRSEDVIDYDISANWP